VLPLWAQDHEAAAQIVKLMPTTRTIELEDPSSTRRPYRFDWRLITGVLLGAALISFGGFAVHRLIAPAGQALPSASEGLEVSPSRVHLPIAAAPTPARTPGSPSEPRNEPLGGDLAAPNAQVEFDGASPVDYGELRHSVPGTAAADGPRTDGHRETAAVESPATHGAVATPQYETVRPQIEYFEIESARLRSAYQYLSGRPTPAELQKIEDGWWQLSVRIYQSGEFQRSSYYSLIEAELAASRAWRRFLAVYADGLRANNREQIEFALKELEFAEHLTRRVHLFD
jgi:hypothetical protein